MIENYKRGNVFEESSKIVTEACQEVSSRNNGFQAFSGKVVEYDMENERRDMIMKIKALNFAIIDIALYLDTHPCDENALCFHREYSVELKSLKERYERTYGPLEIYYPSNKWKWIEEPWPWERGNF